MCRRTCTEHSFSWHATLPPGTFVPPHIHPDQDEYLYILEGKLDFMLDGAETQATPGDLVRLADGQAARHLQQVGPDREGAVLGIADADGSTICSGRIHNMKEQTPDDVVALAAEYNIHFLPPPPGA